jgi:hypothetical protein
VSDGKGRVSIQLNRSMFPGGHLKYSGDKILIEIAWRRIRPLDSL